MHSIDEVHEGRDAANRGASWLNGATRSDCRACQAGAVDHAVRELEFALQRARDVQADFDGVERGACDTSS